MKIKKWMPFILGGAGTSVVTSLAGLLLSFYSVSSSLAFSIGLLIGAAMSAVFTLTYLDVMGKDK